MIWSPANMSSNLIFAACLGTSFYIISKQISIISLYVHLKLQKGRNKPFIWNIHLIWFHWFDIIIYHYHFQPKKSSMHVRTNIRLKLQNQKIKHSFDFISIIWYYYLLLSSPTQKNFHTCMYERTSEVTKPKNQTFISFH